MISCFVVSSSIYSPGSKFLSFAFLGVRALTRFKFFKICKSLKITWISGKEKIKVKNYLSKPLKSWKEWYRWFFHLWNIFEFFGEKIFPNLFFFIQKKNLRKSFEKKFFGKIFKIWKSGKFWTKKISKKYFCEKKFFLFLKKSSKRNFCHSSKKLIKQENSQILSIFQQRKFWEKKSLH